MQPSPGKGQRHEPAGASTTTRKEMETAAPQRRINSTNWEDEHRTQKKKRPEKKPYSKKTKPAGKKKTVQQKKRDPKEKKLPDTRPENPSASKILRSRKKRAYARFHAVRCLDAGVFGVFFWFASAAAPPAKRKTAGPARSSGERLVTFSEVKNLCGWIWGTGTHKQIVDYFLVVTEMNVGEESN